MPRVEYGTYTFPDEDDAKTPPAEKIEVEPATNTTYDVLESKPETVVVTAPEAKAPEVEIEVVDDVPPKDRGRVASTPPEEVTEEELSQHGKKIQQRLKHLSKGIHDERRAKEAVAREREEMERILRGVMEENKQLRGTVAKSNTSMVDQAKKAVDAEFATATANYKAAYETGDASAVANTNAKLAAIAAKRDRVYAYKPKAEIPLQRPQTPVQRNQQQAPAAQPLPQKVLNWAEQNTWFGADDEMTGTALGYHQKLVKDGVVPNSDEYYQKIDARMRQVFPDEFGVKTETVPDSADSVVAPVTRSAAPKKYVLTKTQVALANKYGLPLADYAKMAASLERGQ